MKPRTTPHRNVGESVVALSHSLDGHSAERVVAGGGLFASTLGVALAHMRSDSTGRAVAPSARALIHTIEETGRRIDAMLATLPEPARADAVSSQGGYHTREQLTHVYAEVLRETVPENNAMRLFPIDRSVAPGAQFHKVSRIYSTGDAAVYRAGMDVPRVGVQQRTELFPVRHYVTSFATNFFERQAANFASTPLLTELLTACREVLADFINLMTWFGSEPDGIFGVLTYPWLPKMISGQTFDGTSPEDELAELNFIANFPFVQHRAVVTPNRIATSPRLRTHLAQTYIAASDQTVLQRFLRNQPEITAIEIAHELQGAGPAGADAILVWRDGRRGIQNVIPQGFSVLPAQQQGFEQATYAYMSHGGVILRDPFSAVLAFATVP